MSSTEEVSSVKDSEVVEEELTIENLNFDCLTQIFEKLSPTDQLKVELVSKSWNDIGKHSWNHFKTLKLDTLLNDKYDYLSNEENPNNYVLSIVKRCGVYLKNFKIASLYCNGELNLSLLLKFMTKYCQNLNSFYLNGSFGPPICINEELEPLFQNNKKLSSLSLINLNLNINCLSSLCAESLTKVHLCQIGKIESPDSWYMFLSKLKNVEKFCSDVYVDDVKKVILALIESNCENLLEFNLQSGHGEHNNELKQLFVKQKKLYLLGLSRLQVSAEFLDSLPIRDTLQHLEIVPDEDICYSMYNFKNLTSFICCIENLNDICAKHLSKCENLEKLEFKSIKNYTLTEVGENYFKAFKKLERFLIDTERVNIDNLLKSISECKNLKEIVINNCIITMEPGIIHLGLLKNLNSIIMSEIDMTDLELIYLIDKLPKLKEIYINECHSLTKELIRGANESKTNRPDDDVLEIIYLSCSGLEGNLNEINENDFPLISLKDYCSLINLQVLE